MRRRNKFFLRLVQAPDLISNFLFLWADQKASKISSAEVIRSRAGFYQAIGAGGILRKMEPGTAKTSRLYCVAKSAVISVPLFSAAYHQHGVGHSGDNPVAGRESMHASRHFPVNSERRHPPLSQYFFGKIFTLERGCITLSSKPEPGMAIVFSPLL